MKSVIPGNRPNECFICHCVGTEEHHIFGASDRKVSEKYGLKVNLCWEHHYGRYGAHGMDGKQIQEYLHQVGQERIEEIWIKEGEKYPRARFIEEFRKSYL